MNFICSRWSRPYSFSLILPDIFLKPLFSKLKLNMTWLNLSLRWFCFFSRNLENTEKPVYSVKAHSQIVNAIDGVGGLGIGVGAPEIVTASRDGKIHENILFYKLECFIDQYFYL